ncbi:MAG: hypothetical protein WC627_02445 [Legionella sp.]|jgi:hypothetical protein
MTINSKYLQKACVLIAFLPVMFLPINSFAKAKPILATDLLQDIREGEPSDMDALLSPLMATFAQDGSIDQAPSIDKITLAYFTTTDCTGSKAGTGFYTTPDGSSFPTTSNVPFGMAAASAWNVGSNQLSIADMTTILSIAVTFKSTGSVLNTTPQSNFAGSSFACIPVTCSAGQCTSVVSTKIFTLKTTEAIGDPADGGVIACLNPGNNMVVPTSNISGTFWWAPNYNQTSAYSSTDGAANTATIISIVGAGTYAAELCATYSAAGGYTDGWFLPAGSTTNTSDQLYCIYTNKTSIGNLPLLQYWSSTELSSNSHSAWLLDFGLGLPQNTDKTVNAAIRCARAFVP